MTTRRAGDVKGGAAAERSEGTLDVGELQDEAALKIDAILSIGRKYLR
jgi:hypothetical protein